MELHSDTADSRQRILEKSLVFIFMDFFYAYLKISTGFEVETSMIAAMRVCKFYHQIKELYASALDMVFLICPLTEDVLETQLWMNVVVVLGAGLQCTVRTAGVF